MAFVHAAIWELVFFYLISLYADNISIRYLSKTAPTRLRPSSCLTALRTYNNNNK